MAHRTIALTTELKELDWLESAIIHKMDQVIQKHAPCVARRQHYAKLGMDHLKKDCRDPGSSRGPSDLQSDALPTELSRPCSEATRQRPTRANHCHLGPATDYHGLKLCATSRGKEEIRRWRPRTLWSCSESLRINIWTCWSVAQHDEA